MPSVAGPLPRYCAWLERIPSIGLALADQALVSGANFFHAIAAARCLGMEDFGVFSLAWAVLLFFGNIHQALLLQPLAVLYAEYAPAAARRYLHLIEQWHMALWVLLLPSLLAAWLMPAWASLILATTVTAILRQAAEHERRTAYVLYDGPRAILIDGLTYGPLLVVAVWFWLFPMQLSCDVIMLAAAAPAGVGWLAGRWLLGVARRDGAETIPSPIPGHWGFGKWAMLSMMAQYAGNQAYPFMIAGLLGLREVAALALMRGIMGVTNVVVSGIEAWWTPRARSSFIGGGWSALTSWRHKLEIGLLVGVGSLLIICVLFAKIIIVTVATPEYAEFAWLLQIMALIWAVGLWSRIDGMTLHAMKRPKAGTLSYVVVACVTVAIGPILVIHSGLTGVVVGFALNVIISKAVLWGALGKELRVVRT